jgi:hypothetical protein
MKKYRKLPVVIEAVQWFKNGDHPLDNQYMVYPNPNSETQFEPFLSEGKIVRYYRTPDDDGQDRCQHCGSVMHVHGWIDTLEGGRIVCPSDWVIKGINGEFYPCKDEIFKKTYEDASTPSPACPKCAEKQATIDRLTGRLGEAVKIIEHINEDLSKNYPKTYAFGCYSAFDLTAFLTRKEAQDGE